MTTPLPTPASPQTPTTLPQHRLRALLSEDQIRVRIKELGRQIADEYRALDPVLISVLKGSFLFVSDLVRELDIPLRIEFIRVSSYGDRVVTSGEVKLELDLAHSVAHRHVLLVEDIVDTGLTLEYLKANMAARKPASLKVCTLLHKPGNNVKISNIEFVGFDIPDEFVVGYGLDYRGYYRNLPYIAQVDFAT